MINTEIDSALMKPAGRPIWNPARWWHPVGACLRTTWIAREWEVETPRVNNPRDGMPDIHARARVPAWKRLDLVLVLLTSPVWLPVMVVIAGLVKWSSSGPVLFKQERVGFQGRRFFCLKFRTMFVNADTKVHQSHLTQLIQSDAPMLKIDSHGDKRIIPFGRLLRATGLDELPQLINVLRGEMSLVGPRPCVVYESEQYEPWQHERFNALPGLTGLWQVCGKNRTTFTEMMALDIRYVRNQSLWLDLKIILNTIPALLTQVWETRKNGLGHPASSPAGGVARRNPARVLGSQPGETSPPRREK